MLARFDPQIKILPKAQQELWSLLKPASSLSFVLYGGTAVALHLGHRISIDFDFFRSESLDKKELEISLPFVERATVIQEGKDTLVVSVAMPSGLVKVSFFGGMKLGRVNDPLQTQDEVLIVASLEDLLATKLKAIIDRAEAKDYRDIAEMISSGVSLDRGLAAFSEMFKRDVALPLKAIGFFKDGDLPSLSEKFS
ncbi:MAG: nucleotidyl transferase AbiEii/AbiGii toxin family protein [Afipia sp.]|nr:nucleotidyl transferase AbiEii/AbiGii toxin family protein [Afipia sp.]